MLLRSERLEDPNEAINLVGLAFGQLLVERFGLEWVALSDEHGTEIAVRGPSDFTVFPTNFVAKRYESGDTGFLAPFVDEIGTKLRRCAPTHLRKSRNGGCRALSPREAGLGAPALSPAGPICSSDLSRCQIG
jgi:hypothetical protein